MSVVELAKRLIDETGAHHSTVWRWLAGGPVRNCTRTVLETARERIEAGEAAALLRQAECPLCPHEPLEEA